MHDSVAGDVPIFCVSAEAGTVCLTKAHVTPGPSFDGKSTQSLSDAVLWHMKTGHPDCRVQKLLADTVKYITFNRRLIHSPCHVCRISKFVSRPVHKQTSFRQERVGDVNALWYVDLKDMIAVSEPSGYRYFLIVVDAFSGYLIVRPMKSKSQTSDILMELLRQEEKSVKRNGVQRIISDNGSEFSSSELEAFVRETGLKWDRIPDYSQVYNSLAERGIRAVSTIHRTLLKQSALPIEKWEFSVMQATYLYNALPSFRNFGNLSPYTIYNGDVFDFKSLKTFGCMTFFKNNVRSSKIEDPAKQGIMLGNANAFPGHTIGYLVWCVDDNKIYHTNNLTCDEFFFPFRRAGRMNWQEDPEVVVKHDIDMEDDSPVKGVEDERSEAVNARTSGRRKRTRLEDHSLESDDEGVRAAEMVCQDSDEDYVPTVMVDGGREDADHTDTEAASSTKTCRTRRDFRKQRRDAENRFINRRAEVVMDDGKVRTGTITQVVFKDDTFLVRVTFDDKYWILIHPDSENVRILSMGKEVTMIAMSEAETSELLPGDELQSGVLPKNVFELTGCNDYYFRAFPQKGDNILSQLVEKTVRGNPDVFLMHRKSPLSSQLVPGKVLNGDGKEVLFVLDEGNRSTTSQHSARWIPLRRERWNDVVPLMEPGDDIDVARDPDCIDLGTSELTQCFPDSRMLVTNMALVVPVWEAVKLSAAFLSRAPPSVQDSSSTADPRNRREMLLHKDRELWEAAERAEIQKMEERRVWEVVPRSDETRGKILARAMWVYSSKRDLHGNILKRKARLVVMGNLLPTSEELFAPTTSMDNIRLLLSIAAGNGWIIAFRDIAAAFLYSELNEPMFMIPPDIMALPPNVLLKVTKAIYGTRTAPRRWWEKLSREFLRLGAEPVGHDEIIYRYEHNGSRILITTWVDDLLLVCENQEICNYFLDCLSKVFDFSGSEATGTFLGIRVHQDLTKGTITLSQKHFIEQLVEKFGIALRSVFTILPGVYMRSYHLEGELLDKFSVRQYQALLGTILYVANGTRADISFAVSLLSRFARAPRVRDWDALVHLARYLYTTRDICIVYHQRGVSVNQEVFHNELVAASDSDWGTDVLTRRSQSGWAIVMNGGVISYGSKAQKVISLSSSEAEIYATSVVAKHIKMYRSLLQQLGFCQQRPTMLLLDNEPCIRLLTEKRAYSRLKHIDLRAKFAVLMVDEGELLPVKVPTKFQPADLFTKILPFTRWKAIGSFLFGEDFNAQGVCCSDDFHPNENDGIL
uniref:Integrase catalytic domain-containing protein n=1 Tax=Guillardia theta TaxID=55529 RepID=A0A6U5XCR5_GUITH|mmetsp:Transcript_16859/g.55926  ORF Transcript_16859/g.55926 Transcript_16859/m.55926 type:complete len:1259 (+) Transcript_16859:1576-5352(+)